MTTRQIVELDEAGKDLAGPDFVLKGTGYAMRTRRARLPRFSQVEAYLSIEYADMPQETPPITMRDTLMYERVKPRVI